MGGIRPVILSGGVGTRLWPTSRAQMPKQLLPLTSKKSMLQETAERVRPDGTRILPPYVICNEEHRFLIAGQLQEIGIVAERIILEPVGRNTAPAAAVAACLAEGSGEVLLLLPADHHVERPADFTKVLPRAVALAEAGRLVTFGVVPDRPEIGYGYIAAGDALDPDSFAISQFVEKPDASRAAAFLEGGKHFWNSGMFAFTSETLISEIISHAPDILAACREAFDKSVEEMDFTRLDRKAFAASPAMPFDIAIMEKSSKGAVIPIDIGWSDVGSWAALWEIGNKDNSGNVISGDVVTEGTENTYVRGHKKLITAIGLKDMVVVETDDAILIAHRDRAQNVKDIVQKLSDQSRHQTDHHRKV